LSGVGEPAQVIGARLSGGLFPALEVAPLMGRFFTQQEDDQKEAGSGDQLLALAKSTARRSARAGTKILLDRKPYEIIGVMPRNFEFPLMPGRLTTASYGFR